MATRRVLIVDDSDLIRMIVKISLEQAADWDVLMAASASEGLALAVSERPDAILLDVQMPDLDGPTALRALWASPATRPIPVILVTATEDPNERRRLAELGVAGIIDKPFDPPRLADQIASFLGWSTESCRRT